MLVIYTPYDDGAETETQINQCLASGRLPAVTRKRETSLGLVSTISWCREIAVDALSMLTKDLPPGSLDIHGIRKHGECWGNQPIRIIGNVARTNKAVDCLIIAFFQVMVDMISYTLDDNLSLSSRRLRNWIATWNYAEPTSPVGAPLRATCVLNASELDIPSAGFSTEGLLGSITDIPTHWAGSRAVMSYLFLIPRLWSLFYKTPRILGKLTTLSRKRRGSPLLSLLGTVGSPHASVLWCLVARKLMLPFWFSTFGKAEFWFFTYLLMHNAISQVGETEGIPDFARHLRHIQGIDGFVSWCRWFNRYSTQEWVPELLRLLKEDGVTSVLTLGNLCGYI